MDAILWLSNWFASNCDGDWEHENQIKIETVDNPGWSITIDLSYTPYENITTNNTIVELADNDWYIYNFRDKKFDGGGDLSKLYFLIKMFRDRIESEQVSDLQETIET